MEKVDAIVKLLLLIWCLALGMCIGVYAYIYVSIGQLIKSDTHSYPNSNCQEDTMYLNTDTQTVRVCADGEWTDATSHIVNPQQTINGKELQGGL